MELFRAIPSNHIAKARGGLRRHASARVPSNVPYVVDNLWEWLRPLGMPSRRHAIYASPTPEMALANASAPLDEGEQYIACRVIVDPSQVKIAQLSVRDACEHPDIREIARWVSRNGNVFTGLGGTEKQQVAPLFMPGLRREELEDLLHKDSLVAELCCYMRQASTFWKAELKPVADSDGELFFELIDQLVTYRLEPV